jgi:hypothetical protein
MGSCAILAKLIMVKLSGVQDLYRVINASVVCQTRALIGRVSSKADWRVHGALVV